MSIFGPLYYRFIGLFLLVTFVGNLYNNVQSYRTGHMVFRNESMIDSMIFIVLPITYLIWLCLAIFMAIRGRAPFANSGPPLGTR